MSAQSRPSVLSGETRHVAAPTLLHLVRGHARSTPGAPAVESGAEVLDYGRLWDRVLVTAAALEEAGVGPGDRVALWAGRTPGTVVGALAVMALGAAYVPLDPAHPGERVAAVLRGATPVAFVHDGAGAELPALTVPSLNLRELSAPRVPAGGTRSPERALPRAEDLAYVVFTSGSTGAPKGVTVAHGSLVNYVSWCGELVGSRGSGSPLFASLGYDLALTSLWVPLAQGRTVVTISGMWDQQALFGERARKYGFVKMTPSHARFFEVLAEPPRYDRVTGLLMFGGEALDPALLAELGPRLDGVRLVNHYGPTETTIGCCAYRFDRTRVPATPTVPIGTPAWNTRAYVVDEGLRPVPVGRPGELVVAGAAVAAGYLGGDRAGRFVDERELGGSAGRAYRTGDTVEVLPEGALLYLGRGDDQLKVNGHRVELGELRHHVLAVPGVADAAFDIVRGPVDTLELFVRPAPAHATDPGFLTAVRTALTGALPSALVPQAVHTVREIVVNANGKCDLAATRAALAAATPVR